VARSFGIKLREQPGEVLPAEPSHESWSGGFTDDDPAALTCALLDRVQHDRLACATGTCIERRSRGRAGAVVQTLQERLDEMLPPDQEQRSDAEGGLTKCR